MTHGSVIAAAWADYVQHGRSFAETFRFIWEKTA